MSSETGCARRKKGSVAVALSLSFVIVHELVLDYFVGFLAIGNCTRAVDMAAAGYFWRRKVDGIFVSALRSNKVERLFAYLSETLVKMCLGAWAIVMERVMQIHFNIPRCSAGEA